MEKSYLELYLEYKDSLNSLTTDNVFYDAMENCIDTGDNRYSLFNRYFERTLKTYAELYNYLYLKDGGVKHPEEQYLTKGC